ncbi:proteasome assembly chaperone family protein [Candidatus Woesearchaeota archaeon]|nr:proteasome assembly chaperone family protein [Candidatus Woesearchaeota archaeon]
MKSDKMWIIEEKGKCPKLKNAILIAGLPGIGNVGKITADFLVEELKAKEIYRINSFYFPHSVFINEESLLELPTIFIHIVKAGPKTNRDIILLTGDIQPMEEQASYAFCDKVLELVIPMGCSEIVTVGGIGLPGEPKKPQVYGVATDKKTLQRWKKSSKGLKIKDNKAATIVATAGLLLGLGKLRNISGISLLCETVGHPYHLGLKEATEVLKIIKQPLKLKADLNKIEKEIKKSEIEQSEQVKETSEGVLMKKLKRMSGDSSSDTSYIG